MGVLLAIGAGILAYAAYKKMTGNSSGDAAAGTTNSENVRSTDLTNKNMSIDKRCAMGDIDAMFEKAELMWNKISADSKKAITELESKFDSSDIDALVRIKEQIQKNDNDVIGVLGAGTWLVRAALYGNNSAVQKLGQHPYLEHNSYLNTQMMIPGNLTYKDCGGSIMRSLGFDEFIKEDCILKSLNEDGIYIAKTDGGYDGPDEDGFGMEEYYNFYAYDEFFDPLGKVIEYSNRDFSNHEEQLLGEWKNARDKYRAKRAAYANSVGSILERSTPYIRDDIYAATLPKSITSAVIPDGVRVVGDHAFAECRELKEAHLPEGIEIIDRNAFYFCPKLEKINLPSTLKEIGANAFMHDQSLRKIIIPEGVTSIGESAFDYSGIESVYIPDSVRTIGKKAFSNCKNLRSVRLPEHLEVLAEEIFRQCESLEEIKIPASVKEIEKECFYSCSSLKKVVFAEGLKNIGWWAFHYCKSIKDIELPKGLEKLSYGVFTGCNSLKKVFIPNTLEEISESDFTGCDSIEWVEVEKGGNYKSIDGVVYDKTGENIIFCPPAHKKKQNAEKNNLEGT